MKRQRRRRRTRRRRQIPSPVILAGAICLMVLCIVLPTVLYAQSASKITKQREELKGLKKEFTQTKQKLAEVKEEANTLQQEVEVYEEKREKAAQLAAKKKEAEGKRKVYLTFDDGPTERTPEVLDILKEYNVQATFFVLGYDGEKEREWLNRIVDEGHTLAMHSYSHKYDEIYSSVKAFKKDVNAIHDFLYETTGVDCKVYRFPGGSSNSVSDVDMKKCISWLDEKGYQYYDWNALTGDAEGKKYSVKQMVKNVLDNMKDAGDTVVVLMHDGDDKQQTVRALPRLIETLQQMDCVLLPIDEDTQLVQHVPVSTVVDK